MRTVTVKTEKDTYPVYIGSAIIKELPDLAKPILGTGKAVVITDENLFGLYGGRLSRIFTDSGTAPHFIVLPPGEEGKNLAALSRLYGSLADLDVTRDDTIILSLIHI